jgi:hypothetical protein
MPARGEQPDDVPIAEKVGILVHTRVHGAWGRNRQAGSGRSGYGLGGIVIHVHELVACHSSSVLASNVNSISERCRFG